MVSSKTAKPKICCIFNLASHYREPIYSLMDEELECAFYFGDKVQTPIKTMDVHSLRGYKKTLQNIYIPKTGFEWQRGAWRLIFKSYKYYILTGTAGSLSNWVILILGKILGKKVFVWGHGMKRKATPAGRLISKGFHKLADRILLYGNFGKEYMLEEGFKAKKIDIIYNSLDYDTHKRLRDKLAPKPIYFNHFKNSDPVLIYIGRIQKSKRLDLLIEAVNKLNNESVFCNLVIIGKSINETNEIETLVSKLSLKSRVWFYGPCYNEEEIAELMSNADVCVSPGLIGLTAIHALSFGTPVITNNNFNKHGPEFEAIIEGLTGDFFEEDDLDSLCKVIKTWFTITDNNKRQIKEKAYSTIDKYYNPYYQISLLKRLTTK